MDDTARQAFFTQPTQTYHRRYEALGASLSMGDHRKMSQQNSDSHTVRCVSWFSIFDSLAVLKTRRASPPLSRCPSSAPRAR